MKTGRIGILVGVLVGLTAIAWLAGVFDSDFSTLQVPDWELTPEGVESVTVRVDGDTISAVLQSGKWMLTRPLSAKGDSTHINRLLRDVAGLKFASVVSTNPERYSNFGVDSLADEVVVVHDGKSTALIVGKQTPDNLGTFVRLPDDERVFATSRLLRLSGGVDQWRDKTIISVPAATVTGVAVQLADGPRYSVSNASGKWMVDTGDAMPAEADSANVVRWIRRFSPLRGDGFVESSEELQPIGTLTFSTTGGAEASLVLQENDDFIVANRPDDGAYLRVSKGRRVSLIPDVDSLKR